MVTITKKWENNKYYVISSSKYDNLCAFETKPIPLDNLPAISSICFFCVFVIYINTYTVSFAHFIDDTSISRATWMTVFHLVNIIKEYWYETPFSLSQTDILFIALTIKIDIFSVSTTIKNLSAIPFKRDKGISQKLTVFPVLIYAEPGHVLLKQDKYALMGIYERKTVIEYFMLRNTLRTNMHISMS